MSDSRPPVGSQVDAACDRFESGWRAGKRPAIEPLVAEAAVEEREALLAELVSLELWYRRRAGGIIEPGEYVARFPSIDPASLLLEAHSRRDTGAGGEPAREASRFAAAALVPGALLAGRYRIRRFLARGGMGEVYEAQDLELDVAVALKTLRLDLDRDPSTHKRFRRELLLARSITHANVCRVYDLHIERASPEPLPFLTMELLAGETLRARLEAGGPLATGTALPLVRQMTAALGAAHRAGIVHRDFKSANVMLVPGPEGERVVVTDFGLARLQGCAEDNEQTRDDLTQAGGLVGTPAYMAPEQVKGEVAGPAADLYALGVVLFEMVTGRLPFVGGTPLSLASRRLSEDPPAPAALVPGLEPRWDETILRCLAREPRERFARAEDVALALAGEAASAPAPARVVLPAERDAFVGRAAALAELEQHFADGARLVTLVGPGGTGKTRLAVHHGWQSRKAWPGGVWFADLTEARSLEGIVTAVATALDVPLGREDPIVQLGHAIAGRGRALVILDNCEQVLEHAGAAVGRWRERAEAAAFLVTSRERLGLAGEQVQSIEPLGEEEGVALFRERARAHRREVGDRDGDTASVLQVVRLLDGLPLAIELAAARLRMLTVGQVVERLKDRFRLLGGGRPGDRHATLRAAIDSSWELLQPWEKGAFAQLSVFEGGFTLEAAEEVLDLAAWPEAGWAMDVVEALVDKSLVRMWVPAAGSGARFDLFASLQEYARERLREGPGGVALTRRAEERHGAYFARSGTADAIRALLFHGRAAPLLELDNLTAACRRAMAREDGETAAASYHAAAAVLEKRGPFRVGLDLGRQVLGMRRLPPSALARVLRSVGWFSQYLGRIDEARASFERALAIVQEAGDSRSEGYLLRALGSLHQHQGQGEAAYGLAEQSLVIFRAVGDREQEGSTLAAMATLRNEQSRLLEAQELYHHALAIHREVGDRRAEGIALGNVGLVYMNQGSLDAARTHVDRAIAIAREVGDRRVEGVFLTNLIHLEVRRGRLEEAGGHGEPALAMVRGIGDRRVEAYALVYLGMQLREQGRLDEARSHDEQALAIACEIGNRRLEGEALGQLGNVHLHQGRLEEAHAFLEQALTIHREVGHRSGESECLSLLGLLHLQSGQIGQARAHLDPALAIAREAGSRQAEGAALLGLGRLHTREHRLDDARAMLAAGERLARDAGDTLRIGKVLCARAEVERQTGELSAARASLAEAGAIAAAAGVGPASELGGAVTALRQWLAADAGSTPAEGG